MARLALAAVGVAVLAALPLVVSAYTVSLLISILAYISLATAWAFFSGRTRYISLATAAFVGIGTYTVALLSDHLPLPLVLAIAPVMGFAVAFGVGLSTLRLSGVYFVIFTFGLAELIKQLVIWFEINQTNLNRLTKNPFCLNYYEHMPFLILNKGKWSRAEARLSRGCWAPFEPAGRPE